MYICIYIYGGRGGSEYASKLDEVNHAKHSSVSLCVSMSVSVVCLCLFGNHGRGTCNAARIAASLWLRGSSANAP